MTAGKDGLELPDKLAARIAAALEKLAGVPPAPCDFAATEAFVFSLETRALLPVLRVSRVDISLLRGIDSARDTLLANTWRFARGFAANNALLWGARGMGKSALVKAVHAATNAKIAESPGPKPLKLVEIHREDIGALPYLMARLRDERLRFLVFCDDLSFDAQDTSYKSLKAALEGGIEGRPPNVLFYATSNRRHILPREMIENERSTAINPDDTVSPETGKKREMGLGSYPQVSLADARRAAGKAKALVLNGIDPIASRRQKKAGERAGKPSFSQCAGEYIAAHESAWRNAMHRQQWTNTLRDYAIPVLGALPVDAVTTEHVLEALSAVWTKRPETASRVKTENRKDP